jgi:acyl carrier protein
MEKTKMEKLIEILNDIDDSIDYENETGLIDNHILDSFGIITLVSEIEEAFDVSIDVADMVPENFNSADAIYAMIQKKAN